MAQQRERHNTAFCKGPAAFISPFLLFFPKSDRLQSSSFGVVRSKDEQRLACMNRHHSMVYRPHRILWLRLLLIGLMAGMFVSCVPTFLYRHADRLVLWKIDEYVDLTSDQKAFVRARLKDLLAEHRKDALPIYERFLTEIKAHSADGLDRQEVDWMFARYQELRADLFRRVLADGAVVLSSLTDRQIRYMEHMFQRDHEKAVRKLREDRDSRLSRRASTTLDWLKDWVGPYTKDQQQRIKQLSMALPDLLAVRLEYQVDRQHGFLQILQSTKDRQLLSDYLERWLLFPEQSAPPDYRHAMEHMTNSVKDMILTIDRLITPQQRTHALVKLQRLIDDIHALAAS